MLRLGPIFPHQLLVHGQCSSGPNVMQGPCLEIWHNKVRQLVRERWSEPYLQSQPNMYGTSCDRGDGANRAGYLTKIREFCYETSDNPTAASWRLRCLHDDGSECRRLLRRRCVPSGLRRTSSRCRPTSGRSGSTSSRCCSCCRRSTPQGLLTIGYRFRARRAIVGRSQHGWPPDPRISGLK